MCEVVNINFIHILTLIERMALHRERGWGIFAMITSMTSISKLVEL